MTATGKAKPPWTEDEERLLRDMVADKRTNREIAETLGRSLTSVSNKVHRLGIVGPHGVIRGMRPWESDEQRDANLLDWFEFQAKYPDRSHAAYTQGRQNFRKTISVNTKLVNYLSIVEKVEGDAVVVACVHVPQTDPAIWARVLAVGETQKIKTLVIAGDIVTGDMFSKWTVVEAYSFEEEMESLRLHLKAALAVYDQIVITPGNHVSNRIVRATNGHIKLAQLIQMSGLSDAEQARIKTTEVDYLELRSGGEKFLIGHASGYSKIDGRIPTWYAEIRECHVITGNGHRLGYGVSRSGRWHGFEIGTCANPAYMGYAQRSLSNFPRMMQGFASVKNGAVRLYGADKPLTDWAAEVA